MKGDPSKNNILKPYLINRSISHEDNPISDTTQHNMSDFVHILTILVLAYLLANIELNDHAKRH